MKNRQCEKAPLRFLCNDTEVIDEIREGFHKESLEGLESSKEEELESLLNLESLAPDTLSDIEAIVQKTGRPALLIKDGEYEEPSLQALKKRLDPHKAKIRAAIASTARVELLNHPDFDHVGTAWMVAEDVMITNRHVANLFARHSPSGIVFRLNPKGEQLKPQVDFKEEYRSSESYEVKIREVVHLEENADFLPDMALVRLEPHDNLPRPIELAKESPEFQEDIVVIGYPAQDSRNDYFVMDRIYKGIYKVKRLAPGKVSGVREDQFQLTHDCTTLGGNSGSVVLRISTGEAIALHYSGSYLDNNYAVTAQTIRNRMGSLGRSDIFDFGGIEKEDEKLEAPMFTVEAMMDRKGYDEEFLQSAVELPAVSEDHRGLIAPVQGRDDGRLDYVHFSAVVNAERRMALFTACNVDGNRLFRPRRGRDRWFYDPRLADEFQAGEELYRNNKLQRGHLVRRLDPVWGETSEEGLKAQADTFFWTNCSPQHEGFNPKSWADLEDYVLDNADNHDVKVTVFTGPIFRETDKEYRDFRIPEDFWKVLVFRNDRTDMLSATAYRLTQADLMSDLEFVYGAFRTYQVPVKEIETLTGLDFGELRERDPLSRIESLTRVPIESASDLVL